MSEPASTSSEGSEAKQRVAGFFSSLAPTYGTVIGSFDHFGRRLVELSGVQPGMRVLDVCAGRGASARPARDLGCDVVCVDLAEGMVADLQAQGFDARQMDAESLDFDDDSFDAVLCGFGIFFFPHPEAGAAQFKRVVRPGGPVVCSMPLRFYPDHVMELRKELQGRAAGPAMPTPDPSFDGAAVLRGAGFESVETSEEHADFTIESGEQLWEWVLATGAKELLNRLTAADREEAHRRIVAEAGPGPITLPMSARFWLTSG